MEWLNVFGLNFVTLILVPNIVYAFVNKKKKTWNNKVLKVLEQIGRYGSIAFMIFNIPYTWFGWWSDGAFSIYLFVNSILILAYLLIWLILFKQESKFKVLSLSIIPSIVFLFSGIMERSILLIIFSIIFAIPHIIISYKNV